MVLWKVNFKKKIVYVCIEKFIILKYLVVGIKLVLLYIC